MVVVMAATRAAFPVFMVVMMRVVMLVFVGMLMVVLMLMVVMLMLMFVVVMVFVFMCGSHDFIQHFGRQRVAVLHYGKELCAGQFVPRCCHNACVCVVLAHQRNHLFQTFLFDQLGARQQDSASVFDLVEEELAEVLGVHLGFLCIDHGDKAAQQNRLLLGYLLYGCNDIGQFAHARRLNQDTVGVIGFDDFAQCLAEVADQRAADAARIHFGNLDTSFLEETAVNADFTKFIFDEHDFLSFERIGQQALNQRRFASAQKT